jgi:hypothetical protein
MLIESWHLPLPSPSHRTYCIARPIEVGKSSLILRYADDSFHDNTMATLGIDFRIRNLELDDGTKLKLQLWDTGGKG